ncbi:MAG: NYN domain-containing protein [Gammaproteobacteria bacterium]|nr:MAG: NYN domain-containing protein [Gammaproteobacteria bacterium]
MKKQRAAVYIDGFNLYHAIDDLNYVYENGRKTHNRKNAKDQVQHLKWVNLWALSESLLRDYQELVAVNYYSAYATWRKPEYKRHQTYTKALEAKGVRVVMSVFKEQKRSCKKCGSTWIRHEEKESDVRIAVDLIADAMLDKFDDAFLITADSDLKPAIERVHAEAPHKNTVVVAPPKRFGHARDLKPNMEATRGRIAKSLLPEIIVDGNGNTICTRPKEYNPPEE